MLRSKVVKRKTKNREILLRNLRKGKARLEDRCGYQTIPYPIKFVYPQLFPLCADVVLMEHQDRIILDPSFLNHFKVINNIQVCNIDIQKVVKVLVHQRQIQDIDWRRAVDKLVTSEIDKLREWAMPVKTFCERYEATVQNLEKSLIENTPQEKKLLVEHNNQVNKIRESIAKTYPYFEFKSILKDGKIQLTEVLYNEKFLAEIGHSLDTFSSSVFEEGLPRSMPFDSMSCSRVAKFRLEKFLNYGKEGLITPEFESTLLMKDGFMKKVKKVTHYYPTYEKGVPGFSVMVTVVARQKPFLNQEQSEDAHISAGFLQLMSNKEKEKDQFLSTFYEDTIEKKYNDTDRVCKIRELNVEVHEDF